MNVKQTIDSVVENETKYWLVTRKPHSMLLTPESVKDAKPKEYFGNSMAASILGGDALAGPSVTTKSGMVLIDRNRLLIPNTLFQQISDFNNAYLTTKGNDQQAMRFLSKIESEVRVAEYQLDQLIN
jgi:hypothetical protein